MERRLERERRTIAAMVDIYCRAHHAVQRGRCEDCQRLLDYASRRLDTCPFGADKPTCVGCTVHCYSRQRREQVRQVMRFAGPRMPWRHPVLTLFHFLDRRRPTPALPTAEEAKPMSS